MKIEDYEVRRGQAQLIEFVDSVISLVNNGKFQFQVLLSTTAPTLAGHGGEVVFWRNGTDGRAYVYMGSSWNLFAAWTADASAMQ